MLTLVNAEKFLYISCLNQLLADYRCIEIKPVIKLNGNIADTIWSSPRYHVSHYECKIWSVVIIIAHRWFFGALIFTALLEESTVLKHGLRL